MEKPQTRVAALEAVQAVFSYVRDVPVHRRPFVDLLLKASQDQNIEKGGRDGYEIVWHILADEMVLRMTEAQEREEREPEVEEQ